MLMKTCVWIMILCCCFLVVKAQTHYEVTANTFLNIRSYADTEAPVLGTIDKGGKVEVYEISNGWAKIAYDGGYAYVSADYLRKVEQESADTPLPLSKGFSLDFLKGGVSDVRWLAYVLLALSVALYVMRKVRGDEDPLEGTPYVANCALFLVTALLELVYMSRMGTDATWFCSPDKVGWIWTIINFIVFGLAVFNQLTCFFNTLNDAAYNSYGSFDRRWGIYSWIGGVVGGLVAAVVYQPLLVWILVLFLICQVVQVVQIVKGVAPSGGWKNALLCLAVYLLGSLSTALIIVHFLVLLIIVLLGFLLLSIFAHSGSPSRRCCDNCNYRAGASYCNYRGEYIQNPERTVCDHYS